MYTPAIFSNFISILNSWIVSSGMPWQTGLVSGLLTLYKSQLFRNSLTEYYRLNLRIAQSRTSWCDINKEFVTAGPLLAIVPLIGVVFAKNTTTRVEKSERKSIVKSLKGALGLFSMYECIKFNFFFRNLSTKPRKMVSKYISFQQILRPRHLGLVPHTISRSSVPLLVSDDDSNCSY